MHDHEPIIYKFECVIFVLTRISDICSGPRAQARTAHSSR